MNNYKLTIQYDGTDFHGWQSQPDGNTVQDYISESIKKITKSDVNLIGSGRTDSGVHAFGQVANFKIVQDLDLRKFQHSLNSVLPTSISIKKMELATEDFNSRFDAKSRSYIYLIRKSKSPFYNKYSYQYPYFKEIEISKLNQISKVFLGELDFTSFCKAKSEVENKICRITNIRWRSSNEFIMFYVEANRFLHGMVRTLVGTLLYAAVKGENESFLKKILSENNREAAKESVPAKGLFLFKVKY